MLNGIRVFLDFLNNYWTLMIIVILIIVSIYGKIKTFMQKSKEEQIVAAKMQIKEIVLKFVTDAEIEYSDWVKAGSLKRAQVIQKIFADYPILSTIADQKSTLNWIDMAINESLKQLDKVVSKNKTV
jgi:hypothetical protein